MAAPEPGSDPADTTRQAHRTTIRNEKRKLAATALNNIAVATVVAGLVAPVIALGYQFSAPHGKYWIAFPVLWLVAAYVIHQIARRQLERLEP